MATIFARPLFLSLWVLKERRAGNSLLLLERLYRREQEKNLENMSCCTEISSNVHHAFEEMLCYNPPEFKTINSSLRRKKFADGTAGTYWDKQAFSVIIIEDGS